MVRPRRVHRRGGFLPGAVQFGHDGDDRIELRQRRAGLNGRELPQHPGVQCGESVGKFAPRLAVERAEQLVDDLFRLDESLPARLDLAALDVATRLAQCHQEVRVEQHEALRG